MRTMTTEEAVALARNAPEMLREYARHLRDFDVCIRDPVSGAFNAPGEGTLKAIGIEAMADAVEHLVKEAEGRNETDDHD